MSQSIVTQANLGADEYLETKVIKRKVQPNYYRIGNGTMNKHKIQSIDLLDKVMAMTKAEQLVITTIKNTYDWDNQNNEVFLQLSRILSESNCTVFRKGYKLLKDKNLVRRTKTNHYMINPNAYIPQNYNRAQILWLNSENI
jgi:hypothetical protein